MDSYLSWQKITRLCFVATLDIDNLQQVGLLSHLLNGNLNRTVNQKSAGHNFGTTSFRFCFSMRLLVNAIQEHR
jgi:hypothetical protein